MKTIKGFFVLFLVWNSAFLVLMALPACNAHRPVVEPVEPDKSYHDPDWSDDPSQTFWINWEQKNQLSADTLATSVENPSR